MLNQFNKHRIDARKCAQVNNQEKYDVFIEHAMKMDIQDLQIFASNLLPEHANIKPNSSVGWASIHSDNVIEKILLPAMPIAAARSLQIALKSNKNFEHIVLDTMHSSQSKPGHYRVQLDGQKLNALYEKEASLQMKYA